MRTRPAPLRSGEVPARMMTAVSGWRVPIDQRDPPTVHGSKVCTDTRSDARHARTGLAVRTTPPQATGGWPRMDDGRIVDLLQRSAAGAQEAFAQLYDLTAARVHGVILKVVRSPDLAADISQEVFVEVWRSCPKYDPGQGSVLAWMLTIAHRRAVDRVRSTASATAREERYARADPDPPASDEVWETTRRHWEADRVRSALEQLTAPQREALTLAYFDGFTQAQVADRLELPLGTVKTRMRDGLTRLHRALEVQA